MVGTLAFAAGAVVCFENLRQVWRWARGVHSGSCIPLLGQGLVLMGVVALLAVRAPWWIALPAGILAGFDTGGVHWLGVALWREWRARGRASL